MPVYKTLPSAVGQRVYDLNFQRVLLQPPGARVVLASLTAQGVSKRFSHADICGGEMHSEPFFEHNKAEQNFVVIALTRGVFCKD
jgi:hypothetical protein